MEWMKGWFRGFREYMETRRSHCVGMRLGESKSGGMTIGQTDGASVEVVVCEAAVADLTSHRRMRRFEAG